MPRVLAFLEKELVNVIALSSANEGIVCHKLDGDTYDTGVCTRLVKYARRNQARNVAFGVIACVAGYACYSTCPRSNKVKVGVVGMGICQRVIQRSSFNEVCAVSFGANACVGEYTCLGANGREIGSVGICTVSHSVSVNIGDGGW